MRSKASRPLVVLLGLSFPSIAHAQTAPLTTVIDREQQNQSSPGVRLGSFVMRPSISGSLAYADNVLATDTNRHDDVYFNLNTLVTLASDWSRNGVDGRIYFNRSFYTQNVGESATQYGVEARGRYDLAANTQVSGQLGFDRLAESRASLTSFRAATSRATYNTFSGEAALAQAFGPLSLTPTGGFRTYRYSAAATGISVLNARFRDFKVYDGTINVGYQFSNSTQFIVRGQIERRRYQLRPGDAGFDPITQLDRSADGERIEAGLTRDVTRLISATLRLGYLHYDYADVRLRPISAFSYHLDANWNITPLTTLQIAADRRLDETNSPTTAGNLRNEFRLGAQHELLRKLILTGSARFADIQPSGPTASSRELEFSFGGRYYFGRNLRFDVDFNHAQRTSADRTIAFRANTVMFGIDVFR